MWGSNINTAQQVEAIYYRLSYRHLEMALHAVFRTGSNFEACDDLLQTGRILSRGEETQTRAVVRIDLVSVVGVRQLLEDAIPSSGVLPWS